MKRLFTFVALLSLISSVISQPIAQQNASPDRVAQASSYNDVQKQSYVTRCNAYRVEDNGNGTYYWYIQMVYRYNNSDDYNIFIRIDSPSDNLYGQHLIWTSDNPQNNNNQSYKMQVWGSDNACYHKICGAISFEYISGNNYDITITTESFYRNSTAGTWDHKLVKSNCPVNAVQLSNQSSISLVHQPVIPVLTGETIVVNCPIANTTFNNSNFVTSPYRHFHMQTSAWNDSEGLSNEVRIAPYIDSETISYNTTYTKYMRDPTRCKLVYKGNTIDIRKINSMRLTGSSTSNCALTSEIIGGDGNVYIVNQVVGSRSYTVNFGADEGGTVSGKKKSNNTSISTGSSQSYNTILTFTANPAANYAIDYWTNDGHKITGSDNQTSIDYTVSTSNNIKAVYKQTAIIVDVTLNSNGGSNDGQVVSATNGSAMPTTLKAGGAIAAPAKTGYTFDGYVANSDGTGKKYYNANLTSANNWDKTVATTIYAKWSPNTNTAYTVKHYLQNMDCSTYPAAPFETENLIGKTDASVTPSVKTYTGFTAPSTQTVTILADGSRVVNYYYTRNQHAVTVAKNGNAYGTLTSESDNKRVISNVPYGSSISVSGNTITINGTTITATVADADDLFTYSFNAWKNGETVLTGSSNTVTGTMTITAHFARNLMSALTLKDMEGPTYYNNFQAYNTEDVGTVTYTRNFIAGNWSTLCLPFDVTEGNLILNGLSGQVFAFQHSTGNANVGNQVLLYFSQVSSLDAGVPYLVRTRNNKSNFTFENVIINTEADTEADITDLGKTHMTEGTIALVGTLRKGTLPKGDKHYMGLMGNKIYYPGVNTTVPAYRAYFYDSNPSGVQQRVRIVVDGVDMGELLIDNGELLDAGGDDRAPRKYIRNGVLVIECNGVTYDAQGKRM